MPDDSSSVGRGAAAGQMDFLTCSAANYILHDTNMLGEMVVEYIILMPTSVLQLEPQNSRMLLNVLTWKNYIFVCNDYVCVMFKSGHEYKLPQE